MKIILLATIILVLVSYNSIAFEINEIMYNPIGNDNNLEFVEIIHPTSKNLSGWTIYDNASQDSLSIVQWNNNSNYSLIVEEGYNYSNLNCTIYSVGTSIGNNLNNEKDNVCLSFYIENNSNTICVYYTNKLANDNGYSLELMNQEWLESKEIGGSPCRKNTAYSHPSINNISQNESFYCDLSLSFDLEKNLLNENDKLYFKPILNSTANEYEITYWIENIDGSIAKEKVSTTNSNTKTWTPKTEKSAYALKGILEMKDCIDIDKDNNQYSIVFGVDNSKKEDSLSFLKFYPNKKEIKFGTTLKISLEAKKPSEKETSIQAFIQDFRGKRITESVEYDLLGKSDRIELKFPLKIIENCDSAYPEGIYELVIDNDKTIHKETIMLKENNKCKRNVASTSYVVEPPTIRNIYSRAKKKSDKTNVYVTLDKIEDNLSFFLITRNKTLSHKPKNKTFLFQTNLEVGKNIVVGALVKDNQTISEKHSIIELEKNYNTKNNIEESDNTRNIGQNKNEVTTMMIYEKDDKNDNYNDKKNTGSLLLISLFTAISAVPILWWKKFRKLFKFNKI